MTENKEDFKVMKGHTGQQWFVVYASRRDEETGKVYQRANVADVYKTLCPVSNSHQSEIAVASVNSVSLDHCKTKTYNEAEAERLAHLFAAAPALLKSLKRAVQYFDDNGGENEYTWLSEMKASIKKAEGK